jgi:hypothetical protein
MNCRKFRIAISVVTLVFVVLLSGCDFFEDDWGEKFTIWIGTTSYNEYIAKFSSYPMDDGWCNEIELTDSDFSSISRHLSDNNKHSWSEKKLSNYLTDQGYYDYDAQNMATWLLYEVRHGLLADRHGSTVYLVVK